MGDLLFDLRDTLRGLRHDRLYAAVVIGTLALTLGASTAVFSIVNGVLLRPLVYPDAPRLMSIREILPQVADRYPTLPANPRHFEEWRNRATSFASMAELDWRTTNLTGAGEVAQAGILRASGTLFDVFGTRVALGRPLTRDDERFENPAVTVIAHDLWRDRLGSDPAVLGRTLNLGGTQYTIVGVLPPGCELPDFAVLGESASLRSTFAAVVPFRPRLENFDWMGQFNYPVVARLKSGVGIDQARAELDVLQKAVAAIATEKTHEPADLRGWIMPLEESIVGRARLGLLLLLGAVAGVVLMACANLANLSLTRTLGRMREAAVRSALGATRGRLVRRVVLEQLALAAAGGMLGLLVARAALDVFVRTAPIDLPRVGDVHIDWRVLGFAAAVALVAGLGVALLPAWRIGRGEAETTLRGGRTTTDRGGVRVRATLLAGQVALSVTLLVMTGLFITSFLHLTRVDPGFSTDRVVAMEISPITARYPDTKAIAALYDRILDRVRGLPALSAAAWTSALPLTGETWVDIVARPGDVRPDHEKQSANYRFVGPEYFRVLSMKLLKGRSIEERDRTNALTPAVISARAAETLWPGQDPIGRAFARGNPDQRFEVVGVVADGHPTALETQAPLMVYVPYWFNNEGKSVLVARTSGDPAAVIGALRRAVHEADPEIAIASIDPLQNLVDRAIGGRRYQMWLFTAFGVVALLIASVGVYATTAYGVSRRRREMNIRVALGARTSQVFALVLRQSTWPVALGVVAGGAGALAVGTIVAGLLFQVQANDPLVIAGVTGLVGAVGGLAAATAARGILSINPAAALRDE